MKRADGDGCDNRDGGFTSDRGGSIHAGRRPWHRQPAWAANAVRACFLAVFVVNVQCALSYVADPQSYQAGFQLHGMEGAFAVQGLGVAFLMWNATYPAFIAAPRRFPVLGWVIVSQQAIGLVGESLILAQIPAQEALLRASIERFIAFDAAGLALMAASFAWLLLATRSTRA